MGGNNIIEALVVGFCVGAFVLGIVVGVIVDLSHSKQDKEVDRLTVILNKCELPLPRDQHCELIAVVKKGDKQ